MSAELFTLFQDRRFRSGGVLACVVLFALANLGVARWKTALHAEQERNLLRASGPAAEEIRTARFDRSVGQDPLRYWAAIPDTRTTRLVILTGMSQMYAINEAVRGDQTISEWLDDMYAPSGIRVFGLAAPNLANEEALFLAIAEVSDPATTPKVLIIGVCFDKFRNVDLREGYLAFMQQRPRVRELWRETALRYASSYPLATAKMRSTLADTAALASRDTTSLESRIRDGVATVLPVVRGRQDLNFFVMDRLYEARNKAFGISTSTKRPLIRSRYDMNREFLELVVEVARAHGVQVVLYVNPLNPLAVNPYVPAEYESFKSWLADYARRKQLPLANLENEVPAADWGMFLGGPDFMHFKGEGHRKTALGIAREFDAQIRGTAAAMLPAAAAR